MPTERSPSRKRRAVTILTALFLFLFIPSVFGAPITDGYRLDFSEPQSSSYQFADNSGFNNIVEGKFSVNPSYPIYDTTLSDTQLKGTSLIGELCANDSTQYLVTLNYAGSLKVWGWNSTLNSFMTKASFSIAVDRMSNPILAKFSDKPYPYIIVHNESSVAGRGNIYYLSFNGTNINIECTTPSAFSGNYHSALVFDSAFGILHKVADATLTLFDSDCANMTTAPFSTGSVNYYTRIPAPSSYPQTHNVRPVVTNLHGDGNHQIVLPTYNSVTAHSGLTFITYSAYGSPAFDSAINGKDLFNSDYTCSSGVCSSVGDTIKMSNPVYDQMRNQIFVATENLNIWSNCGNYCIWSISTDGNSVWNTQDSSLTDACGQGSSAKNVTFFQPVLYDHPHATGSQYEYGGIGESAICGACQQQGSSYIDVACFDTYDGTELAYQHFYIGLNLYSHDTGNNNFHAINQLYAANFESSSAYQELFVYDAILPYDLSFPPIYSFPNAPYSSTKKFSLLTYGAAKEYDKDFYVNPMIMLANNQSNRIYYTAKKSYLPDYVTDTYIVAPSNDKPLCLNFTRDQGLRVQYFASDSENEPMYAEHYCDLNTIGGFYYNWTNWTYIGEGGEKSQEFYCRYNATGSITLHTRLTDTLHLYNYTPLSYNSKTKVYNIVDSYYPYCYNDYTYYEIVNPPVDEEETEEELLERLGIGKNETMTGAFRNVMDDYGLVTTNDRMFFGFLILFAIIVTMVFVGVRANAERAYYTMAIPIVTILMFILGTILGIFSVWLTIVILIITGILGGMVMLRITGQASGNG